MTKAKNEVFIGYNMNFLLGLWETTFGGKEFS